MLNRFNKRNIERGGFCLLVLLILLGKLSQAEVSLPEIFGDGIILQQNKPLPIWGFAAPGERITVEFADQIKNTTADFDGRWIVTLEPMVASQTSRTLRVKGSTALSIDNVLVGEVWLFSGQSNMALSMESIVRAQHKDPKSAAMATAEIEAADDSLLRLFCVDNNASDYPRADISSRTGWMEWTPANAGKFSAMAYYTAKRLREKLNVPVGIILSAWGGSGSSAWISRDTLQKDHISSVWPLEVPQWRATLLQSRLYNGMIHPLAPLAISGFGWYHGETEATYYHNPYIYRYLLAAIINDWRKTWGDQDLPFCIVQLPNRLNEPRWVVVRESQAEVLKINNTSIIPTIDIGQEWDLHPSNKHEFGLRFANHILGEHYNKNTWPGSPQFDRFEKEKNGLRLFFTQIDSGLQTSDGKPPTGFTIAGKDQTFKPADARIEQDSIFVWSNGIENPVALRYAWQSAPKLNLANSGGIPVIPFRTDNWPVDGQEMDQLDLPSKASLSESTTGVQLIFESDSSWMFSSDAENEIVKQYYFGKQNNEIGSILVRGFSIRNAPASPILSWTMEPKIEKFDGITVEAKLQVLRIGHDHRGFDIEAGVIMEGGVFRRYLMTIFPSKLHTFQDNIQPRNPYQYETHILYKNRESAVSVFRIAIRPDGIAQIYVDDKLMGLIRGQQVDSMEKPYIRIGKTTTTGEWMTRIHRVSFDLSGAFSPFSQ